MGSRNLTPPLQGSDRHQPAAVAAGPADPQGPGLLENINRGIDTIAQAAGMGTATTLRRHFNRATGVTPDAYRRTFRDP